MSNTYRNRLSFQTVASAALLLSAASVSFLAQGNDGRTKNNPYFPSPSTKAQKVDAPRVPVVPAKQVSISAIARLDTDIEIRPAAVQRTPTYSKKVESRSASPTATYNIGVGDVIYVNLKNAPNSSGYVTVKANGMIDFPIAGDKLVIAGRTTEEAAEMIAAGITIYPDPQVEIKVRDYRSHKITVAGLVDRPGETSIQREAVPLYVICAQVGVDPKAAQAFVRRADLGRVETFDLRDPNTDKVLVYPGNVVEFSSDTHVAKLVTSGFYYIAGKVNSTGQKEFASGMTLTQAITASGGATGNPKKAIVRRKSDKGILNVSEYDLRAIKDRKNTDPMLAPGDMIEVGN